jgi:uncharacterized protein (TIGR04255 family)
MSEFVRPHYQNAPIAEALIDIRVANPDAVTLERLTAVADALASEFPNRQLIQHMQMGFQAGPDAPGSFFNAQEQIGWRLAAKDQSRVLQVQRIGFTYSHLPPYTDWNTFRDEARRYWTTFRDAVGQSAAVRIAVRVINKIPTPSAEVAVDEYLSIYPVVPEKMPATVDAMFVQLQLAMPKILPDARAIMNVVSGQSDANGTHLVLDIDLFANRMFETEEEIWSTLEKFGIEKDVIFEACITPKVREAIQ